MKRNRNRPLEVWVVAVVFAMEPLRRRNVCVVSVVDAELVCDRVVGIGHRAKIASGLPTVRMADLITYGVVAA